MSVEMDKLIVEAWNRIGRSEDGRMARKLLTARLLQAPPASTEASALNRDAGERTFADRLIQLLDAGLERKPDDTDAAPRRARPRAIGPARRAV